MLRVLVACGFVLMCATPAFATDYYIDGSGGDGQGTPSDSNTCEQATNINTAKATINGFLDDCGYLGSGEFGPGDTLLIRGGIYDESICYKISTGTNWTTGLVRLANYNNETVWMAPTDGSCGAVIWISGQAAGGNSGTAQYIELDGLRFDADQTADLNGNPIDCVVIDNADDLSYQSHHIRIKNGECVGSSIFCAACVNNALQNGTTGIITQGGNVNVIGNNEIINMLIRDGGDNYYGIALYLQTPNTLVENNRITNWTGSGVQMSSFHCSVANPEGGCHTVTSGNIVRNNTIYDMNRGVTGDPSGSRTDGIILAQGGFNNQIYNNLIYNVHTGSDNFSYGIQIYWGNDSLIANNTVIGSNNYGVLIGEASGGNNVYNNIAFGNGTNLLDANGTGTVSNNSTDGTNPRFVDQLDGRLRSQAPDVRDRSRRMR